MRVAIQGHLMHRAKFTSTFNLWDIALTLTSDVFQSTAFLMYITLICVYYVCHETRPGILREGGKASPCLFLLEFLLLRVLELPSRVKRKCYLFWGISVTNCSLVCS